MKPIRIVVISFLVVAVIAVATVYSGTFNIAADDPHWGITSRVIETMRNRSISRQAKLVAAPGSLEDPKMIANGAGEYAEMCAGCHLAPGMKDTELRKGLYPMPPELGVPGAHRKPEEQFWIIKHGLKMTGMPAWGLTHDDGRIWAMVAFLQKLPAMSPAQYQEFVEAGLGDQSHDHAMERSGEGEVPAEHAHAVSKDTPRAAETGKPPAPIHNHGPHSEAMTEATSSLPAGTEAAAAVVDDFQKLLARGKTREASALLDPNVLIFEGGGAERSRAEYASHHLKSDAEFLKNANVAVLSRTGSVAGDLAWIATESQLETAGAKPLDFRTTETMVLKRTPDGWRVTHIHWSSKAKK